MSSNQAGAKTPEQRSASAPAAHDARQPAIRQPRLIMLTMFQTVFFLVYIPSPTSFYNKIDAERPEPLPRPIAGCLSPSVLSRAGGGGGATAEAGHAAAASASTPRLRRRPIAGRLHPTVPSRVGWHHRLLTSSPFFLSPSPLPCFTLPLSPSISPFPISQQRGRLEMRLQRVTWIRRSRCQAPASTWLSGGSWAQAKVQALASMHAPAPALRVSHCENSSNAQQMLSLSHSVKSPAVRRRYACACEDWERCRGWRKPHRAPARSAW